MTRPSPLLSQEWRMSRGGLRGGHPPFRSCHIVLLPSIATRPDPIASDAFNETMRWNELRWLRCPSPPAHTHTILWIVLPVQVTMNMKRFPSSETAHYHVCVGAKGQFSPVKVMGISS